MFEIHVHEAQQIVVAAVVHLFNVRISHVGGVAHCVASAKNSLHIVHKLDGSLLRLVG